jgi:hypothetical protein
MRQPSVTLISTEDIIQLLGLDQFSRTQFPTPKSPSCIYLIRIWVLEESEVTVANTGLLGFYMWGGASGRCTVADRIVSNLSHRSIYSLAP